MGKTTGAHGLQPSLWEEEYKVRLRGNDLELYVFANGSYKQKTNSVCLSLSLSLYIQQYTTSITKAIALSHIYTYMKFWAIYKYNLNRLTMKHIYTYVLWSGLHRIHPDSLDPVFGSHPEPFQIWFLHPVPLILIRTHPEGPNSQHPLLATWSSSLCIYSHPLVQSP